MIITNMVVAFFLLFIKDSNVEILHRILTTMKPLLSGHLRDFPK